METAKAATSYIEAEPLRAQRFCYFCHLCRVIMQNRQRNMLGLNAEQGCHHC